MTLPEQSDRAVAATREFLVRLTSPYVEGGIKGIRREVRAEALRLLRHYPYVWLSQKCDCPVADNAANGDNNERLAALRALTDLDEELSLPRRTPAANATPSEGSEQGGCTLTDAEREALEVAAVAYGADHGERFAATLRGLLERTK